MARCRIEANAVDPHWLSDVLDAVLTQILELERQLALHLVVGGSGDGDPARVGHPFDPGGDVHAVSVDSLTIHDDVAQVDPDAELQAAGGGKGAVPRFELSLEIRSALH